MVTSQNARVVRLVEDGTQVLLTDNKSNHISARTVTELISACRMLDKAGEASDQFRELVDFLSAWIGNNVSRIGSASLAIRSDGLLFLVVQRAVPFDEELSEALTELDIEIANDDRFSLLCVNTLALPKCSGEDVEQFYDPARQES